MVDNRKKQRVFLSLGSNLGDRKVILEQAIREINALPQTEVLVSSPLYKTEAWGGKELKEFLNMALELQTELPALDLLKGLQEIEVRLGRESKTEPSGKYEDRRIDIDILYYAEECICEDKLVVPHPGLKERRFVLQPLADIAPDYQDPIIGKSVLNLLRDCQDTNKVERYT